MNDEGKYDDLIIPARVVEGLKKLNEKGRREDDKDFIKGLLVGAFTVKSIKNNVEKDKYVIQFIKGNKINL